MSDKKGSFAHGRVHDRVDAAVINQSQAVSQLVQRDRFDVEAADCFDAPQKVGVEMDRQWRRTKQAVAGRKIGVRLRLPVESALWIGASEFPSNNDIGFVRVFSRFESQRQTYFVPGLARAHDRRLRFLRPAEVDHLIGDPAKAKKDLGWEPSVDFKGLVHMMVDADLARIESGQLIA